MRVHMAFGLTCPILGDHKYSHWNKLAPQVTQYTHIASFIECLQYWNGFLLVFLLLDGKMFIDHKVKVGIVFSVSCFIIQILFRLKFLIFTLVFVKILLIQFMLLMGHLGGKIPFQKS